MCICKRKEIRGICVPEPQDHSKADSRTQVLVAEGVAVLVLAVVVDEEGGAATGGAGAGGAGAPWGAGTGVFGGFAGRGGDNGLAGTGGLGGVGVAASAL